MKGSGPRHERETVIVFNEEDNLATIWTASAVMDQKLRKLGLELVEDGSRHSKFMVPKAQVSIRRKPRISESAKARAAERMRKLNEKGVLCSATPINYGPERSNGVGKGKDPKAILL